MRRGGGAARAALARAALLLTLALCAAAAAAPSASQALSALPADCSTVFIFGLGTGRCGSVSLWRLLRQQRGARPGYVTHEAKPLLRWDGANGANATEAAKARLALLTSRAAAGSAPSWRLRGAEVASDDTGSRVLVGDVSSSYLPYAEALLKASPCTVLLMLQREREATLRSWRAKAGAADFWRERPAADAVAEAALVGKNATDAARTRRAELFWAPMFPKYTREQAPTKDDAIRLYWEEYASRGAALEAAHPGRFRVFPSPAVFEDQALQEGLLRFAGVVQPRAAPGQRYNCVASCQQAPPPAARTAPAPG